MAVLSDAERRKIWAALMRRWSAARDGCGFAKADLRAAVDALDDWLDGNAVQINATLPQPFKGAATPEQKALLLSYVALVRYGEDPREV